MFDEKRKELIKKVTAFASSEAESKEFREPRRVDEYRSRNEKEKRKNFSQLPG